MQGLLLNHNQDSFDVACLTLIMDHWFVDNQVWAEIQTVFAMNGMAVDLELVRHYQAALNLIQVVVVQDLAVDLDSELHLQQHNQDDNL